jgi:hypothetical protein
MSRQSILRSLMVLCGGAAVMLALSGVASASATVTRFTFSDSETFPDAPPECMPVVKSGVTNATLTGSGQITETDNGFALHLSNTFVYRTDFSDGSYLAGAARAHFSLIESSSRIIQTDVVQEPRTIYSADGTPIGQVIVHALTHTTTDTATGETTASVDRFFFTCH